MLHHETALHLGSDHTTCALCVWHAAYQTAPTIVPDNLAQNQDHHKLGIVVFLLDIQAFFLLIKTWWLNHRKYFKNSCLSHWLDFIKYYYMNFCQNFQQFQWTSANVCHSILTHLVLLILGEKPLPYVHVLKDVIPSWWGFLKEIIDWGCSYPCFPPGQSWGSLPSLEEMTSGSLDHMTSGPGPEAPAKQLPRWVGEPPCFTFHLYFHSSTCLPKPSQLYFLQVSAAGEPRPGELVFWAEHLKLHMQWPWDCDRRPSLPFLRVA